VSAWRPHHLADAARAGAKKAPPMAGGPSMQRFPN